MAATLKAILDRIDAKERAVAETKMQEASRMGWHSFYLWTEDGETARADDLMGISPNGDRELLPN